MPVPTSTEKPSTSETATTDMDNSANLAAQQAHGGLSGQKESQGQTQEGGKSEVEKAAEREYEERIEDEYAKREGGA